MIISIDGENSRPDEQICFLLGSGERRFSFSDRKTSVEVNKICLIYRKSTEI